MNHKTINIHETISTKNYPIRDELKAIAIKATDKLGGIAMIDDRYVIVDLESYEVMEKLSNKGKTIEQNRFETGEI